MPVTSIEPEHLVWLIRRLKLPAEDTSRLVSLARSPEKRAEVLSFLESKEPGTEARLLRIWDASTGRGALHLWALVGYESAKDDSLIKELVLSALRRTSKGAALGEDWVEFPKKRKAPEHGEARLRRVRFYRDELIAVVQIAHSLTWDFDGQTRHDLRDRFVDVSIDFRTNGHLIKAFASQADARKAVLALVSWLSGKDVMKMDARAYKEFVEPLSLKQGDADALERDLKLTNYIVQGPSPDGKYSEMKITAPQEGDTYAAFEPGDALVTMQRGADLESLGFHLPFKHEDGYVERPHFGFVGLQGRHGHITFYKHTSRPASEMLLGRVYARVRPR